MAKPSLLFILAGFAAGCSAIVDSERLQCSSDADCRSRGSDFANTMCVENFCEVIDPWSCSEHPTLKAKSTTPVSVDFSLFDGVTMMASAGVEAKLCKQLDVECALPVATQTTSSDGVVQFDVVPLFDGYVQLTLEGYDPTLMFLPPVIEDVSLGMFPLTTTVASVFLGSQLGSPLKEGTGRVLVTAAGCDKQSVAGVAVEGENMGADAARFYSIGGFPTFTAMGTDESGYAGFVNVEPGSITLNAEIEDGRRVGRVALFVRNGWVTLRRMQPWTD